MKQADPQFVVVGYPSTYGCATALGAWMTAFREPMRRLGLLRHAPSAAVLAMDGFPFAHAIGPVTVNQPGDLDSGAFASPGRGLVNRAVHGSTAVVSFLDGHATVFNSPGKVEGVYDW